MRTPRYRASRDRNGTGGSCQAVPYRGTTFSDSAVWELPGLSQAWIGQCPQVLCEIPEAIDFCMERDFLRAAFSLPRNDKHIGAGMRSIHASRLQTEFWGPQGSPFEELPPAACRFPRNDRRLSLYRMPDGDHRHNRARPTRTGLVCLVSSGSLMRRRGDRGQRQASTPVPARPTAPSRPEMAPGT